MKSIPHYRNVTHHGGDCELARVHLLRQPVDLPSGIAKDDGLGDGNRLVEITKGVEFPLLLFNGNVELLDTLEGQLITLDENSYRITHELLGDLEDISGHSGGEQHDLSVLGKELEDYFSVRKDIQQSQ